MDVNKRFPRPVYAFGNPEDVRETDPDAAETTFVALARGLLHELQTITGHVDGLEGTDFATEAKQDTQIAVLGGVNDDAATQGSTGSISAKLRTLTAQLNTLAGYLDGLETLIASTNTKLDTLHTDVTAATPAGTNLIGRTVADASAATGGVPSTARLAASAASTNATNVKTSAGRVYAAQGKNTAAYDVFLVLYDAATSPPVPGTTTIRKKICIPAGNAFALDWPLGMTFSSGIGYAFTKLGGDADTTAIAANDIVAFNLDYA